MKTGRGSSLAALLALLTMTLLAAPASALLPQQTSPTTEYYPEDDPALYDDPLYAGDPCDPATYPGWESDPYCNPAAFDDPGSPGGTVDANDPLYMGDPCDPATYPGWESDPYCNPAAFDDPASATSTTMIPPTAIETLDRQTLLVSRTSDAADTPLTEISDEEAPAIGAGRMLLAIDAIAELGGFERATTPWQATLLRDIRDGIPAAGLDEAGYSAELESFVLDFLPYLESMEQDGIVVSEDLWNAALDLNEVLFTEFDPATADPADAGLLDPRPWLGGLADLLLRDAMDSPPSTDEADEAAIRDLLAAFATTVAAETTTTEATSDAPDTLALETPAAESEAGLPIVPIASIGLGVAAVGAFALARRSKANVAAAARAAQREIFVPDATSANADSGNSQLKLTELLDASRRMSASLDFQTIAAIALKETSRIVAAEGGIVVRRRAGELELVGCDPRMLFDPTQIANSCLPRVIETGRSTAAIATDEPLLVDVPMAVGAVPIVADGVITGAIMVVRVAAKPFDRGDLDALEMLAPMVGSALANAVEHETVADLEPLTGLHNRRRLDLDLAAISTDDEVAYVMVDIDHFKNFNDSNGHAAGDEALRRVSTILQASVRPKDFVYRYGGEEFCVLLPGATAAEAADVAERARAAVEAAEIAGMEHQPTGRVTISVGVSDSAFGTPDDLVERADAALYESKRNGRNRVTLSS